MYMFIYVYVCLYMCMYTFMYMYLICIATKILEFHQYQVVTVTF